MLNFQLHIQKLNEKPKVTELYTLFQNGYRFNERFKVLEIRDSQNLAKLGLGAEFLFIY